MFAIYTPNGRTFAGTLEKLRKVEKTNGSTAPAKHNTLDDMHTITRHDYRVAPNMIAAYKQIVKRNEKSPIYHAYQIMSSPVEVLKNDNSLKVVVEKFKKFSYHDYPIINSQQQLIGTLSRNDVYEYFLTKRSRFNGNNDTQTLQEIFLGKNSKAYSAEPVTDIRRISALMIENNLHAIPIIEDTGRIVGIVSKTDILTATIAEPPLSLWC